MRAKGLLTLLERNVEKVVLVATVVLLIAAAALQFLGQPNAVEVGGRLTPPGEVDKQMKAKAESLDSQIQSESTVDLPEVESIEELFRKSRDLSTLVAEEYIPWGARYYIDLSEDIGPVTDDTIYAELMLPAPLPPVIRADVFSLDRLQLEDDAPDLLARLTEDEPADIRAVSVETSLDVAALRTALDAGRESDDLRPIPTTWYEENLFVFDVLVERQRLLPDGSWTEPELLATMPDRQTLRHLVNGERGSVTISELLEAQSDRAENIEAPRFYPVRTNEWIRPTEVDTVTVVDVGFPNTPLGRVERDLQRQYERRAQQEEQKERIQEQISDLPRGTPGGRGSSESRNRQLEGLQNRLDGLDRAIERIDEEIRKLVDRGEQIDPEWDDPFDRRGSRTTRPGSEGAREEESRGTTSTWPGSGERRPGGRSSDVPTLLEREDVTLWSHDIDAEPGQSYRYRLSYQILNPFYGKSGRLSDRQRDLADPLMASSPWSEWSDTVEVPAETYFFVVAANPAQKGTPVARAAVEMYSYYDGFWRRADASLEPGDTLAKAVTVSLLADEEQRRGDTELEKVRLVLQVPVTLLDVVERPLKRVSPLGTPISDHEAVLANSSGQVLLRTPYLEVEKSERDWLSKAAESGEETLRQAEQG